MLTTILAASGNTISSHKSFLQLLLNLFLEVLFWSFIFLPDTIAADFDEQ
jgi:hypothetical protein